MQNYPCVYTRRRAGAGPFAPYRVPANLHRGIMSGQILLCTDLDRTLLPNGTQPESQEARPLFRRAAARPELTLAYVSGRDKTLLLEAIRDFDLPVPDFAIGDVGTTIYRIEQGEWRPWPAWSDEIAPDWRGLKHEDLAALFTDMELRRQEPQKQGTFKLSYYTAETEPHALLDEMRRRLSDRGVRASLVWSVDETQHIGLLDLLPEHATKRHAIEFLMRELGVAAERTVFAGDSGNDLAVLASPVQSVLVRNATDEVRRQAIAQAESSGHRDRLYLAQGGLRDMNGNYAAGILEGLVHFVPEAQAWLA